MKSVIATTLAAASVALAQLGDLANLPECGVSHIMNFSK